MDTPVKLQPGALPQDGVVGEPPLPPRSYVCDCGHPVFFQNSLCLQCGRALGYDPRIGRMRTLEPGPTPDTWLPAAECPGDTPLLRRCANLETPAACNWLIDVSCSAGNAAGSDVPTLCAACRLNRRIPDLSVEENGRLWARMEQAKRRLVSALVTLGLPVASRVEEDPEHGLAFDFLRAADGEHVITGHDNGVITLNLQEADDVLREKTRSEMHEPYRTPLGHLRHEVGHYYWQRLVEGSKWIEPFRELFGDERADYTEALERHYEQGPPPDWAQHHVSAYASSHPWEDWAETWAHYLHMIDAVATARSFALDMERIALHIDAFRPVILGIADDPDSDDTAATNELQSAQTFLDLLNTWVRLTAVLNEMSRSMDLPDFYPFVLSVEAVRKLYLVHQVVVDVSHEPEADAVKATALATPE